MQKEIMSNFVQISITRLFQNQSAFTNVSPMSGREECQANQNPACQDFCGDFGSCTEFQLILKILLYSTIYSAYIIPFLVVAITLTTY